MLLKQVADKTTCDNIKIKKKQYARFQDCAYIVHCVKSLKLIAYPYETAEIWLKMQFNQKTDYCFSSVPVGSNGFCQKCFF